jgi:hypothetical protein
MTMEEKTDDKKPAKDRFVFDEDDFDAIEILRKEDREDINPPAPEPTPAPR